MENPLDVYMTHENNIIEMISCDAYNILKNMQL